MNGRKVPPGTFMAPSTLCLRKCFLLVPLETMGFREAQGCLAKKNLEGLEKPGERWDLPRKLARGSEQFQEVEIK